MVVIWGHIALVRFETSVKPPVQQPECCGCSKIMLLDYAGWTRWRLILLVFSRVMDSLNHPSNINACWLHVLSWFWSTPTRRRGCWFCRGDRWRCYWNSNFAQTVVQYTIEPKTPGVPWCSLPDVSLVFPGVWLRKCVGKRSSVTKESVQEFFVDYKI
jgi:hypothetical protein